MKVKFPPNDDDDNDDDELPYMSRPIHEITKLYHRSLNEIETLRVCMQ